jgi:hypothetical protein
MGYYTRNGSREPQANPAVRRLSAMISQYFTRRNVFHFLRLLRWKGGWIDQIISREVLFAGGRFTWYWNKAYLGMLQMR